MKRIIHSPVTCKAMIPEMFPITTVFQNYSSKETVEQEKPEYEKPTLSTYRSAYPSTATRNGDNIWVMNA
ncbi:hypothetical protein [Pedobacter jeongneungensis]|uniref:hypothetical protein n=1 Tax=Pedobacter jeongneungensis TaxID=947309 RepID=UPI000469A4D6|nr:hypothetical protein [Pedobacter jeongneungensis]